MTSNAARFMVENMGGTDVYSLHKMTCIWIIGILFCFYTGQLLEQNITGSKKKSSDQQVDSENLISSAEVKPEQLVNSRETDFKVETLRWKAEKLRGEANGLNVFWIGSLVSLASPILGALIGGITVLSSYLVSRKSHTIEEAKLQQDKVLNREQHNIALFQNLGHVNLRVQLAAASMLMQRL